MLRADEIDGLTIGGMPEFRLEWHLDNWRRWMRSDDAGMDAPSRSTGFVAGGYSGDFDSMVNAADIRCAQAVNALIEGLSPAEEGAINHAYLYAIYRFPRDNFKELLEAAKLKIARGLVSRGFY